MSSMRSGSCSLMTIEAVVWAVKTHSNPSRTRESASAHRTFSVMS